MNSKIGRFGIAAAVCGALLVGCDSVKDVREAPFTPVPSPSGVLQGSISGLGNSRPVVLSYDGTPNCREPDPDDAAKQVPAPCKFYGVAGIEESHFSFGSLPNGTAYNITVERQPYGKICTVSNGSGSIGGSSAAIAVSCADDQAVPRLDLTVNISAELQALPNLKVKLETEEDVLTVDATGQASIPFPGVLFNSGTSLPGFRFQVTATTDSTTGGITTTNFCTFTPSGSFSQGGQNIDSSGGAVVPTAPVTVTASTCSFTPSTNVVFYPGAQPAMPAGGMQLALRNHFTGVDEQTLDLTSFSTASSFARYSTFAFPSSLKSHVKSVYEMVVTRQPTGMHCVVAGIENVPADTTSNSAGISSNIQAPTASAVMLVDPRNPNWWAYENRQVRCRNLPTGAAVLRGTYQMDARVGTQPGTDPARPFGRARDFITFFEDGTFLFGINANSASYAVASYRDDNNVLQTIGFPNDTFKPAGASVRGNWAASSGVTHGFYDYDSVAGTITFTVFTSTSINTANRGITGMSGYTSAVTRVPGFSFATALNTGTVTASNVVKGSAGDLGTLSMEFGSGTGLRLWTMTERQSIPGELTGTWVSDDHRRVWVYNQQDTYAFHMGVNGLGNLQDVCMLPTDGSTPSKGVFTKHAGSATDDNFIYTCTPGIWNLGAAFVFARTIDLPHYLPSNGPVSGLGIGPTTPQAIPAVAMRFPGMQSQLDNRPTSPVEYEVVPGTGGAPDTLHIQNTLNGTPIDLPLTFTRQSVN